MITAPANKTTPLKMPPVPDGKAGFKALQALVRHRSPLAALETLHREMGDIFRINTIPGFNPVVLVGPEANKFVLVTHSNELRWRMEQDPITRLLRQGLLVIDGEPHDKLRHLMSPAFHRRMITHYIEAMWRCTDRVTSAWVDGKTYDMLAELRRMALIILFKTLFNVDLQPELERLWPAILKTLKYVSPGAWLFWPNVPRPGYTRAAQQLDGYLHHIIQTRRKVPGDTGDLLGQLVAIPDLSDDLIRDQLLTMIVAGHDTVTALMAWTLYLLGKHPGSMLRVQTEIDAMLGAEPPTFKSLGQLNYLEQVIKEAMRLYPPAHAGMRRAAKDLNFQGYHIPAGTRIMYSIYLSHRQPDYWPEPDKFDPDRFTPEQHRQRPAHTYVPFGGGSRHCIGAAFGLVEAKVVLARILQQFNLTLIRDNVHPHMGVTLEPRPGVITQVNHRGKS